MIICGFPGTGKSMMAKFTRWVDLESTPFEKDWLRYAKVAKHMSDNGYVVMASTHKELLAEFEQMEVPYTVIIPPITDKNTYIHRYDMRGNTNDFIRLLDDNWERWINAILEKPSVLKTIVVLPKDGCIMAYAGILVEGEEHETCGCGCTDAVHSCRRDSKQNGCGECSDHRARTAVDSVQ